MKQYKSSSRLRAITRFFKELFREHPNASYFEVSVRIYEKDFKVSFVKDMDRNWVVTEAK